MTNSTSIFTKRFMGLDRSIWWVMLVFAMLSIGLAGYKISGEKPCVNMVVAINGTIKGDTKTFYVGETVRFVALFAEGKKVVWDFGDRSNKEQGMRSTHTYKTEGVFPVTIIMDGKCIQYDQVTIRKFVKSGPPNMVDSLLANPINGNFSPTVGQAAIYSSAIEAKSYEWFISSYSNYQVKNTREAQFTFQTPGLKTLQLILDGDSTKIYKRDVIVQQLPVVNPENVKPIEAPIYIPTVKPRDTSHVIVTPTILPPVDTPKTQPVNVHPQTVRISDVQLKDLLQDVVRNDADVADFNSYLCDQGKTRVLVNDEKNWTNLAALCDKIRGDKKVTIKEVQQVIENGCVVKIKVKYDRKKPFPFIGKD